MRIVFYLKIVSPLEIVSLSFSIGNSICNLNRRKFCCLKILNKLFTLPDICDMRSVRRACQIPWIFSGWRVNKRSSRETVAIFLRPEYSRCWQKADRLCNRCTGIRCSFHVFFARRVYAHRTYTHRDYTHSGGYANVSVWVPTRNWFMIQKEITNVGGRWFIARE